MLDNEVNLTNNVEVSVDTHNKPTQGQVTVGLWHFLVCLGPLNTTAAQYSKCTKVSIQDAVEPDT